MANSSDEEADSRTALVGAPRTRSNPRSTSRSTSHDSNSRPAKRQRRNRNKNESDLKDFVPRGGAFTANALPIDPDSTSSSGSSSDSGEDSDSDTNSDIAAANPHAGSTAPAISWNQGRKAAVRTTLGKRAAPTSEKVAQFEAVNDKYWRSRSGSVSSASGEDKPSEKPSENIEIQKEDQTQGEDELEDGEIDSKSESSDSDSLGSEADDSILLNIGDKMGADAADDYSPADLAHKHGLSKANSHPTGPGSKEEAFRLFSSKYPNAPTSLVDLSQQDLEILANVNTVVLGISTKAVLALTGDDAKNAVSAVMTNQDVPQSYAISQPKYLATTATNHTWNLNVIIYGSSQSGICIPNKSPYPSLVPTAAAQSILLETVKRLPFTSSSFTLKNIDPDMITNLNTVAPPHGPAGRGRDREWTRPSSPGRGRPGPPSRGNNRNNYRVRSPSPDEDDMMSRVSRGRGRPIPQPRGNIRGNIKFSSGLGAKRGDSQSRKPSHGRPPFAGNNNRSRSPPPLPRGPPPSRGIGRGRGSQRGGPSRGPRGGGRGRGW
ncbi:hypothetical protein N7457_007357 [Penicillium paradoxum]|uniref:uncharacterized protein n=1 Tax=Penicillium paradoxum TaxID=176176 RepID=UPI002547B10E|nr:uncharacterized protein N7457_007357 [Penicillium paradoxum]KAJ5779637.1 hypothetical protein N7457_007357 [Penicillium paradoxum]